MEDKRGIKMQIVYGKIYGIMLFVENKKKEGE